MGNQVSMLGVACGQTDVWACFYHEIRDEALLDRYRAMLTAAERQKELRFRFPGDQRCYVVTRALLRTVLSRYAPLDPSQWLFALNAYGKPEIANPEILEPDRASPRISFNLSHTDGLIVLAVSAGTALGIDTENIRTREAPLGIADGFFASDEVAALRQVPVSEQPERFFSYWTLKEAYIKARGMGLSIALDKFSFHFAADHGVSISFRPPLNDDPSKWRFRQFSASPVHLTALCTERDAQSAPAGQCAHIDIRKVVPLQGEEIIACPVLRESH